MDHFEMVEKLRQRANVTYEEAKNALEACNWDILDALVLLENEGRVQAEGKEPQNDYSTKSADDGAKSSAEKEPDLRSTGRKIRDAVVRLIRAGNRNFFTITRKSEEIVTVPVTVLVLLLICIWPATAIALIVALFFGCRYSFSGPDIGKKLNTVLDRAADAAQKHDPSGADTDESKEDNK